MENKEANEKLMSAVINGEIEIAIEALQSGASIHTKTVKGNNLLYVAASRQQESMFDWLLEVEQADKKIDLNSRNNMGATTLMELISEDGNAKYVKKLLENGADPNITNNAGMSPLIQACSDKKIPEVQALLDYNVDVNYVIPDTKTTAFLMSASQSSMILCEMLKEKNADINAVDAFGKNALISAIYKADSFMKKKEKVEHQALCLFLTDIGIDVNYVAKSGMTALWAASLKRNPELTERILEKGANADVWHEVGLEGRMSALHLWMNSNNVDIVKKLIASGAKLGLGDDDKNVPEAFGFLNPDMRELMLDLGADVNTFIYEKKKTPNESDKKIPVIYHIISGGNKQREIVKKMIDKGALVTFEQEDLQKYEPIMIAITSSAVGIVEDIVNTKQVDLNKLVKVSDLGSTMSPLMLTVSNSLNSKFSSYLEKMEQYKLIIAAKEINDKNKVSSKIIDEESIKEIQKELKNMEFIVSELQKEKKQIFDILLDNGADVNIVNEDGRSAIFISNSAVYLKWLKEAGADLFIKDNDGNNPFIYSILNAKSELMSFIYQEYKAVNEPSIENVFYQLAFADIGTHLQQDLLEKGIVKYLKLNNVDVDKLQDKEAILQVDKINYQDEDGNTPILVACANDLPFLVSMYQKLGADINKPNNNNEVPLMHAISTNNEKIVEFLIDKGANLNVKTFEGKSILDFALETENKHIIEKVKIGLGHEILEGSMTGVKKIKM